MERIDLFQLYSIGSELHPIAVVVSDDTTVGRLFMPLMNASAAIERLLGPDAPARLDFCRPDAALLRRELGNLQNTYFRDGEGNWTFPPDGNLKIEAWRMYGAKNAMAAFEAVFRTDMQRSATYLVPKRGTYDLGDLVDRANETFPPEVRVTMGPLANDEYISAGRCYAFGLYTASGYHSCRAIEAVFREYYRLFTGKADNGKEQWGDLIGGLEKCSGALVPEPKTLSHIRHVKDFDRNPLAHVRAVLDATDADMLFAYSKVTITAMAAEINKKRLAGSPVLALAVSNAAAS
ncbi:hypothetical protein [Bosea sp. PAMC 26642]|uniref:hypothetical protein n=1 Tax=Bosea sp. (strain PAMC 26642) TaxID=1792307 RepID=UPI00077051C4|nr:hypothetical protein [Bosea sp. PAMC 26642]AMJ59962.1 hypothetical protein AXW83_06330 [Bosea sp. PAMC 26642]